MTGTSTLSEVIDVAGPWEHRRVAANGARFHVATLGDGPLVLMLHGFPEFWWAWRHQMEPLAAAGWRVAAMDLRGYGGSDKTPRGYDPATFTADVSGVIRSLGERTAVLVGHGWGAYVAWSTAAMRTAHVRALAALSMPHPLVLRRNMLRGRLVRHLLGSQLPLAPERRLVANGAARVETILRNWSSPESPFPDDEAAVRYRNAMSLWPAPHCSLEYQRWVLRSLPRVSGRRFALRISDPLPINVLALHGSADRVLAPSLAADSRDHVAGPYRAVLIDGAGHFPHEEAPEKVTAELTAWLAHLPPE